MRLGRYVPEFVDAAVERAYRLATRDRDARFARGVLLVGNAVSLPFILNDYHVLGLGWAFALCEAARGLWLAVGAAAWRALRGQPPARTADRWLLAWVSCVILGTIVISDTRTGSSVTGLVVFQAIAFACYVIVPFRYSLRLRCSIIGSLAYLAVQSIVHVVRPEHLVPAISSLTITNAVGALAAYQIESSRRQSYRRSLRLREAKRSADEANLAKSRFLAAASHDLRQPVHALGLFLGALQREQMSAAARDIVEHMDESIHALGELFTALMDISALDARTVEPQFENVALAPLLQRICREYAVQAHLKGLALKMYVRPLFVWSDPVLLERVLRNVIANAVRYTDGGRVVVGCRRAGNFVEVCVLDTGRGIAPGEQARIFEEFYTVDSSAGGLGLGLAIVKRLTALLEISLHLESQPDKGTLFTLTIPGAAAEAPRVLQPDYTRLGPGLVLIVDDDEAVLAGMQSLLKSWDLQTIAASSYAGVCEHLAQSPAVPDLMICDLHLGNGTSGTEVISRLRERFGEPVPALLVSGDTAPHALLQATASDAVFLQKPVSNAKLRAAVSALMRAPLAPLP